MESPVGYSSLLSGKKSCDRVCIPFEQKANFGELFVGNYKPESIEHLFVSIQTFNVIVWGKAAEDWAADEVRDKLYTLSDSCVLLGELLSLIRYRYGQIDFIDEPVELGFDCPLDLHCSYTRDQLLVAIDFMKPATARE